MVTQFGTLREKDRKAHGSPAVIQQANLHPRNARRGSSTAPAAAENTRSPNSATAMKASGRGRKSQALIAILAGFLLVARHYTPSRRVGPTPQDYVRPHLGSSVPQGMGKILLHSQKEAANWFTVSMTESGTRHTFSKQPRGILAGFPSARHPPTPKICPAPPRPTTRSPCRERHPHVLGRGLPLHRGPEQRHPPERNHHAGTTPEIRPPQGGRQRHNEA